MFEALELFPAHHVSRVTDHVSFPTPGKQLCQREMQLRLPELPSAAPGEATGPFVVSLGQFRRRRLPDLRVTDGRSGAAVNLLSRRQHGHLLAIALLRPHCSEEEWNQIATSAELRSALDTLRQHLSRLITSIVPNPTFKPHAVADELMRLLHGVGASDERITVEVAAFELRCEEAILATRHLCWVDAAPGRMVQLRASWTLPEAPQPSHESEDPAGRRTSIRRRWRNFRNRQYTRAKMMPVRYVFATPAYTSAGSYYFSMTPPKGTEVLLLDWDDGCRYAVDQTSVPATTTTELESATWSYHFHNHRLGERRHQRDKRGYSGGRHVERRQPADRRTLERRTSAEAPAGSGERRVGDRRGGRRRGNTRRKHEQRHVDRRSGKSAALIHVFVRGEQNDNGKLFAIGLLSLGLAILAARGVLQSNASDNASQILLLAPATLVLLVDQQSHQHFASLTRAYRLILWVYIVLALVFASSIVFSVNSIPLVQGNATTTWPRIASAIFAIASGLLASAFAWAGGYFAWSTITSYRRVCERIRRYGTWSLVSSWVRYKRFRRYRRSANALSEDELLRPRRETPTHEVYAKLARHNADGFAIGAVLVSLVVVGAMIAGHWGEGEACSITRVHAERIAAAARLPLTHVRCVNGNTHYSLGTAATSTLPASARVAHAYVASR